jgi:hypothetical protein
VAIQCPHAQVSTRLEHPKTLGQEGLGIRSVLDHPVRDTQVETTAFNRPLLGLDQMELVKMGIQCSAWIDVYSYDPRRTLEDPQPPPVGHLILAIFATAASDVQDRCPAPFLL